MQAFSPHIIFSLFMSIYPSIYFPTSSVSIPLLLFSLSHCPSLSLFFSLSLWPVHVTHQLRRGKWFSRPLAWQSSAHLRRAPERREERREEKLKIDRMIIQKEREREREREWERKKEREREKERERKWKWRYVTSTMTHKEYSSPA